MNALHLAVFVRAELKSKVVNVKAESVATGFLNMVGNKGGLAIKFSLHGKSYCFINSHLAAHQSKVCFDPPPTFSPPRPSIRLVRHTGSVSCFLPPQFSPPRPTPQIHN